MIRYNLLVSTLIPIILFAPKNNAFSSHPASSLTFGSEIKAPFGTTTTFPLPAYKIQKLHRKDKSKCVSHATRTTSDTNTKTKQDEFVDAPASLVFYDNVLDESIEDGVVCARGVCVLEWVDDESEEEELSGLSKLKNDFLNSYIGPRSLLFGASILYGTNFPLGAIMNDAFVPSAATSARMFLAALALSPFLFKLDPKLSKSALLCGCFTALGYTTQSIALQTISPATVAFLGCATVLVCPTLAALIDKKDMSLKSAPQTWLAAILCLVGVGILELYDPNGGQSLQDLIGIGDFLAILQAIGFGTSFFITERMMRGQPDQALPITAVQVSVSAFISFLWVLADGWLGTQGAENYGIPNLFFQPTFLNQAALAVAFTGFITTALNRFVETTALGKMSSAEASVILATEPLFAAFFTSLWLGEQFGINDYVGGALIVAACLANTLKPSDFAFVFGDDNATEKR
eukprot:CAMPEP_0178958406 /NCGR_PEP_ID=MMETSP0789-20121207/11601_1 /TAXON_ID=3005 /ORGANISM="Rhizosolenia setigera, Strain CCMP 1694" /LENGTH=461 /DNA_ID=CAMNT_0020641061 /DNA_START=70 /DNA_END=1455 /DNA_ORIENTATION=-